MLRHQSVLSKRMERLGAIVKGLSNNLRDKGTF